MVCSEKTLANNSPSNSTTVTRADASRVNLLNLWVNRFFNQHQNSADIVLSPLSGDAGFRNYFRFSVQGIEYLAVDAAPETSNNLGFVAIACALRDSGAIAPNVIAFDEPQGFLIIEDLGKVHFADAIAIENNNKQNCEELRLPAKTNQLYRNAIEQLVELLTLPTDLPVNLDALATKEQHSTYTLPLYDDDFVSLELSIFSEWLLEKHLKLTLSTQEKDKLAKCFSLLIKNVGEQPKCFMHRDYHSRNLLLKDERIAVIDFQDAVNGPITYDIVSLLRDCYQRLPQKDVDELFDYFVQLVSSELPKKNPTLVLTELDKKTWRRWFDLMGIQRHIKASGIFARLYHRDDKPGYLPDIPLTLEYIVEVAAKYPEQEELAFLAQLIQKRVQPALGKITAAKG